MNEVNDKTISNTDEITIDKNSDLTDIQYEYYFNESKIIDNPFDLREDKNSNIKNIMVVFEKIEKGKKKKITINSFDTDYAYVEWGKRRGIPVDEMLNKEKKLIEFIEKNDIEAIYEKTGKLPKEYIEYESKLLGNGNKVASPISIFQSFNGGTMWTVANTMVTLKWTNWDNEISSYMEHAVYGGVSWYDKGWYRSRLGTTWNFGWHFINFEGSLSYLNDRTSSLINW